MKYIFPVSIMILQIGAAVVYACQGNYRMLLYWIAAVLITGSVTF